MNWMPFFDSGTDPEPPERPHWSQRFREFIFGKRRDVTDRRVLHQLSLVAFLAWVGLGADGISSSCYGPEEAFRTLGEHTYLAVMLAVMMTFTVTIIAIAYSRVIEHFPQGGGGYVVATALLGEKAGLVSGSALLVDYILTITISIAAAGDALFSFLPMEWHYLKLPAEAVLIIGLITINIRGVKESILILLPIFLLFVVTHAILIVGGFAVHTGNLPEVASSVGEGFSSGLSLLGFGGMALLFIHAYSLGGGTYTGIEAVSNGLPIMREPKVRTGKRTMVYMAASLAFTASGLIVLYLLWNISPVDGKTMNAVLVERFVEVVPFGTVFVILTLLAEGALLVVAAQAGFVDGPRVLANMAVDGWMPRRFSNLSEQLTTRNGILLMGTAAMVALIYTGGSVQHLVVMYSINVFLTFSITETGMCRFWFGNRRSERKWKRKISIHLIGLILCLTILVVISVEKFSQGGWVTLLVTTAVILVCMAVRRHYRSMSLRLTKLYASLMDLPTDASTVTREIDKDKPTGVIMVGGYGGLGIHTTLKAIRDFPEHCANIVFVAVAVVDSDAFKVRDALDQMKEKTNADLERYVRLANSMGFPAEYRVAIGTDAVAELDELCQKLAEEYPNITYFAGHLVFGRERWYTRLLHNGTAFALQKRLQLSEKTMIILPARVG